MVRLTDIFRHVGALEGVFNDSNTGSSVNSTKAIFRWFLPFRRQYLDTHCQYFYAKRTNPSPIKKRYRGPSARARIRIFQACHRQPKRVPRRNQIPAKHRRYVSRSQPAPAAEQNGQTKSYNETALDEHASDAE